MSFASKQFFMHHFSFKCWHPQHWANHRSSYLSSDLPSRAGDSVLTSVCFGELCPCLLQLKCKQQYFTRDLIQMYLNSFCWLFLFFNVKGCSIWLAIFEMCTGICRFFLIICAVLQVTPLLFLCHSPHVNTYIYTYTPDNDHVEKSCANECIGLVFSLTLTVLSPFFKEFCPFVRLKIF